MNSTALARTQPEKNFRGNKKFLGRKIDKTKLSAKTTESGYNYSPSVPISATGAKNVEFGPKNRIFTSFLKFFQNFRRGKFIPPLAASLGAASALDALY